ncbi:hypothetical protein UP09_23850 [Bradyrhizobium sp. LTSP885]|nr:hypothetical protein UP09_23850 [Bradyrhizobium sp. LTSP885]
MRNLRPVFAPSAMRRGALVFARRLADRALLVMPTTLIAEPRGVKLAHALSKRARGGVRDLPFIVGGRFVLSLVGGQ